MSGSGPRSQFRQLPVDRSHSGRVDGTSGRVAMFQKLFAPAEWVSHRLKLSRKFLVLALCLGVPMAYATWQFSNAKEFNVRIAVREHHGVAYMKPAVRLF